MLTIDSRWFQLTVYQPSMLLGRLPDVGLLKYFGPTQPNGGTDEPPPHPVDPYGSRMPTGAEVHGMSNDFLVVHPQQDNSDHGTDQVLAGRPPTQGPKKPIDQPQPFDPYGSKKPTHRHGHLGSADIVELEAHNIFKAPAVSQPAPTLAQMFHNDFTANKLKSM